MTATFNAPDTVTDTVTDTVSDLADTVSPFAAALGEIEYLLDTDPDAARERFAAALALASRDEREFLDRAAEFMTRSPWKTAARQLGWMAKSRPELRSMIIDHTAEGDPGLHRPELPPQSETSIEAAEWVRRSIRERRYRDRYTATPSAATDAARYQPEKVAARRARIPAPINGVVSLRHRGRDLEVAERRHREYAGYAAQRLYAIDTAVEDDRTPPVPDPRKKAGTVWAHVQAELWDRSYFLHIAESYTENDRHLLAPSIPERHTGHSDRHTGLEDAAREFLRDHDTEPEPWSRIRRACARRSRPQVPPRITPADQSRFAARRTGIPVPSDRDEYLPYSELDIRESTWQGSGLDYDLAAMTPYLGWPCVGCWIDRPARDRRPLHSRDGLPISDDGLCDVCRADGHPAIPALPSLSAEFDMQTFVESRCAHIAATHPAQARALLDRVRAAAANTGPTWRLITRWIAMNLGQPEPAPRTTTRRPRRAGSALGAGQRIGRCDACARNGVVHADNYCTNCRIDLGLVPATRTPSVA
ncbi:hypothetical protein [Nocardia pseudovaccinii]|uniref:hypothetical protein n=1 Tax=Nocardia pseudovaccinii TaxID=189540 RepID=UPI0007A3FB8F|nr:hypothetical protein [Nocardia pseudovaccinii]